MTQRNPETWSSLLVHLGWLTLFCVLAGGLLGCEARIGAEVLSGESKPATGDPCKSISPGFTSRLYRCETDDAVCYALTSNAGSGSGAALQCFKKEPK